MSLEALFLCIVVIGILCGLTPSLVSIFTALISGSLGQGHGRNRILGNSTSFFIGFIIATVIFGTAFWLFLGVLTPLLATYIVIFVAFVTASAGLVEIKDYFWYGQGLSHRPHKHIANRIHRRTTKKYGATNSVLLGMVALGASVTNIGLGILAITSLLFVSGIAEPVSWLVGFSLALIVPLVIILLAVGEKTRVSSIIKWKEDTKGIMRLGAGITLILLAWLVLLVVNSSVAIGVVI